jgi:hypothetical protein
MRLLKRHTDEDVGDERTADERDADTTVASRPAPPPPPAPGPRPDHAGPAVPDGRTMDPAERPVRDRPMTDRPMTDRTMSDRTMADRTHTADPRPNQRFDPATERVAPVADRPDRTARPARPERVETEDVVIRRWSWADAAVALVGAGLALVGILAMTRTGVNTTLFSPVENVLDASHTQLLGAIEAAAGGLLVLAALGRTRILATLIGLAMAVGGAYAAIETAEVARELAVEDWWAWTMAGVGVLVVLLAVVPRRGRVERVVRTT